MIKDFLQSLAGTAPELEEPLTPPVAMGVLQIRLAKADGSYDKSETDLIARELSELCHLTPDETADVLGKAEELEAQGGDNVRFTKCLKDAVDYDNRARLVESLWKIALADGRRDFEEDGFMRLIANLIGVNDRDSALARQRVEARR